MRNIAAFGIAPTAAEPKKNIDAVAISWNMESKPMTDGERMRLRVTAWNTAVATASEMATTTRAPSRVTRKRPMIAQAPSAS